MTHERPGIEGAGEYAQGEAIIEQLSLLDKAARVESIARDPEVRKGMEGMLRLAVNAGISVADTVPVVGDVISLSADAAKGLAQRFNLRFLDTSPDVSFSAAITSELIEPVTMGMVPSHLVETTLQARADWPLIKTAYLRARSIWTGRAEEISRPAIMEAIQKFIK